MVFEKLPWKTLKCAKEQLRLDIVLKCGQSFRWTKYEKNSKEDEEAWLGVLSNRVWLLKQDDEQVYYKAFTNLEGVDKGVSEDQILWDYFQLDVDLSPLYKTWSKNDPVFDKVRHAFSGVRMLRQDPVENLFSFICSSNNNIQRIAGMVENLCTNYGNVVADFDDQQYYAFPQVDVLAENDIESNLRKLGFGYRAKYISQSAKLLNDLGGREYLLGLRSRPYEEARQALLKLTGIGPKVADCILLMSLDKPGAIPVDTHMYQIACKNYLPHLKGYKTVTDKIYNEIGNHFRDLYGEYAGWAHSVLFSADLRHFQDMASEVKEEKKKPRKRKHQS